MPFVIAFALGISIIVVLTILEGRKDRRRHAPIVRRRGAGLADDWIDASDGVRLEQPIHRVSSNHGRSHHGHHHGHGTGHHGGGFDSGHHGGGFDCGGGHGGHH